MTPTTAILSRSRDEQFLRQTHIVTFAAVTYAAGGVPLTFPEIEYAKSAEVIEGLAGYETEWDNEAQKLLVLKKERKITTSVNPASLATDAIANLDVTVTGAATTDDVWVVPAVTLEAGIVVQSARVQSADTVRLRLLNTSAGTVDAAAANWDFILRNAKAREIEATSTELQAFTAVKLEVAGR